jgi:hypothetical protein
MFANQSQVNQINSHLAQLFARAANLEQAGHLDRSEREIDQLCQGNALTDAAVQIQIECDVPALVGMSILDSALRMATVNYNNLGNDYFLIAGQRKDVAFLRASARCHSKALALAERAMDADHLRVIALYGLGRAAAFQGQADEARRYLQASLEFSTTHPNAQASQQQARQWLTQLG